MWRTRLSTTLETKRNGMNSAREKGKEILSTKQNKMEKRVRKTERRGSSLGVIEQPITGCKDHNFPTFEAVPDGLDKSAPCDPPTAI